MDRTADVARAVRGPVTPTEPPFVPAVLDSSDRQRAIEHAAGLLGIRLLDALTDGADLARIHHLIVGRLGLGTTAPRAPLEQRVLLLGELLEIAVGDIDSRWPQRIVTAACDLADAEGVEDLDEIRAFVAAFVQRSFGAQPARRGRHFRAAVEWADEVGYLYGSVHAERSALHAYREALDTEPARALDRLERAIFHRSARALARDTTLPEWRLSAAELCARLERHDEAINYFLEAWPALDASGNPASDRMIRAFHRTARSARAAGDLESSVRFSLEAVRRIHIALERIVDDGDVAPSSMMLTCAELELDLGAALAETGDYLGALRWALHVVSTDPSVVAPATTLWTSARSVAASYHRALGQPRSAAELLTATIDELQILLGPGHPVVAELDRQLRSL